MRLPTSSAWARAGLGLVALASLALAACNSCCPRQRSCCPPPSCAPSPCAPFYNTKAYAVVGPGGGTELVLTPPTATAPPVPMAPPQVGQASAGNAAAATAPAPEPEAPKSLFDRLGGLPAITAVVDEFLLRLGSNEVIKKNPVVADKLAKADATALRQHLIDQICQGSGGPCTYKGRDMKTVHTGMAITEEEWNSTAADLTAALDKFNVPQKEKDDLFALLVPMKGDIVGQ